MTQTRSPRVSYAASLNCEVLLMRHVKLVLAWNDKDSVPERQISSGGR